MKRFVSPVILIVALIVAAGLFTQKAIAAEETGTSTVTVTVPTYVEIRDLPATRSFTVGFVGTPPVGSGSATSAFSVDANVATETTAAITTATPTALTTYMSASASNTAGTTPGTETFNLSVSASNVPLTVLPADYVETVTVTVTYI